MALIETRATPLNVSFNGLLSSVKIRLDVWRTRRALAGLEPHQLKDIGVSAAAAEREAQLGLWDVPSNWSCS